jgi:hypothetical protein
VIGTKIIQLIEGQPREKVVPAVREFLAGIREALDALPAATPRMRLADNHGCPHPQPLSRMRERGANSGVL